MSEGELFTEEEVERYMRDDVAAAGGAKKWLRRKKLSGFDHILHMITNGRAATIVGVLDRVGFERVVMYRPVKGPRP